MNRYFRFCHVCMEDRDMLPLKGSVMDFACAECGTIHSEGVIDRLEQEDMEKMYAGMKKAGMLEDED